MSYSDITFNDPNSIKRWLQTRRLKVALDASAEKLVQSKKILDFGAGDGELCKWIVRSAPQAQIACYEPTPSLLDEARTNLASLPTEVTFHANLQPDLHGTIDLVFCLEVFEHLPNKELNEAFDAIFQLLRPQGCLVLGVPVEVGLPALYKGLFRMTRRYGAFDANWPHVWNSMLGRPPSTRPEREIAPGFNFHFEHMGFDFRQLESVWFKKFQLKSHITSPFNMGTWCMPEAYFVLQKI